MDTSKIYLLEIIKVKDIKTGKEYVWIYEGKDMFSKCFGDNEMIKGKDLEIIDTSKYCYIMFYSFCCQDLSVAGKQAGMKKNSGTRSGLLWEVERLLRECKEYNGNLPDVLILENVPQLHSKKNMPDFQEWINFLTSIGYSSHWKDLNAKFYGVPQNRDRTFMVSLLGEYDFEFPNDTSNKFCSDSE